MRDIPFLKEATDLKTLNSFIEQFNFLQRKMSLSNFDGQVIENIEFEASEEKSIPHKLGVVPKYRIILRQEGNGVISDIPSSWNRNSITLKNNGSVAVIATILVLRE